MERKIEMKDQFKENMKRKYDTKQKDEKSLKPKGIKMKDLDCINIPTKIHMIGDPSKPSAKPQKKDENQLQGGQAEFKH